MKYLLTLTLAAISIGALAQNDIEKVAETVTKGEIEGHIYFLADDLLMGRQTGTTGNKIAAAYLANTLRSYGVKPNPQTGTYFQEFDLEKTSPGHMSSLTLDGVEVQNSIVVGGKSQDLEAMAVPLGFGLESDYQGEDVKGKVVLVKAGSPDTRGVGQAFGLRSQKAELAKKAGAVGILEVMEVPESMWGRILHYFESPRMVVPSGQQEEGDGFYVWLNDSDGSLSKMANRSGSLPVSLRLEGGKTSMVRTQNVIGVLEGNDPVLKKEYVIYSAHYDHVGIGAADAKGDTIYNGARDNAVGTTTVLAMARNLAKYPTKRSALFILFTAEEKGLLGSEYYVEHPVIPLEQVVYCFNSDNGGYNNTSLATIIGLTRTTAQKEISDGVAAFGLKAIEDPAPEQGLFDRSDNVHFAAKGIPAPTFSMGFDAFDAEINKYYHQPGDHADSIDYDYLLKFFRAYVMTGRNIANMSKTPFWVNGDKYEAAGRKLYNRNLKLD